MRTAVNVKPLENYLLLVKFDNGEDKVFNCYSLFTNKIFDCIKDKVFFQSVHIDENGIVCWNDYTDINPYVLYEDSESVENLAFAN